MLTLITTLFGILILACVGCVLYCIDHFVILPLGHWLERETAKDSRTPRLNVLMLVLLLAMAVCLLILFITAAHAVGCFFLL